jgi:hypothetical protein
VRRSRVTNSSKDELALFREIYMWKQVIFVYYLSRGQFLTPVKKE